MSETSKPVRPSEADAAGQAGAPVRVGMFPPLGLLEQDPEAARAFLTRVAAAGIDHICCGDHVSFFAGMGFDGLVQAAALAMLHPALPVYTGVYLLPLRHPVLVARQLADIARIAPGRLIFGTGIGGEDRHEVAACGVDPGDGSGLPRRATAAADAMGASSFGTAPGRVDRGTPIRAIAFAEPRVSSRLRTRRPIRPPTTAATRTARKRPPIARISCSSGIDPRCEVESSRILPARIVRCHAPGASAAWLD